MKNKIAGAIGGHVQEEGVASGMTVDLADADENEITGEEDMVDIGPAKKKPERKTKQQRTRATRLRAEVRLYSYSMLLATKNMFTETCSCRKDST